MQVRPETKQMVVFADTVHVILQKLENPVGHVRVLCPHTVLNEGIASGAQNMLCGSGSGDSSSEDSVGRLDVSGLFEFVAELEAGPLQGASCWR